VMRDGQAWVRAGVRSQPRRLEPTGAAPASKAELINFLERLEAELDETGFLFPPEKRPSMVRNLRNMFQRMAPTESEINTLHGVVVALRDKKGRGRKVTPPRRKDED